jgi:hypothetical protein
MFHQATEQHMTRDPAWEGDEIIPALESYFSYNPIHTSTLQGLYHIASSE